MNKELICESLLDLYEGQNERVGFVLEDGSLVEVENIAPDPDKAFLVCAEDVIKHEDAVATWHTHPSDTANLSAGDYETFVFFPDMLHFIVGTDGVRSYKVENGRVLCEQK